MNKLFYSLLFTFYSLFCYGQNGSDTITIIEKYDKNDSLLNPYSVSIPRWGWVKTYKYNYKNQLFEFISHKICNNDTCMGFCSREKYKYNNNGQLIASYYTTVHF